MNTSIKEKCVMCARETEYNISDNINLRYGYIEGMGQLCASCYHGSSRSSIIVDHRTIIDTPNDSELGMKVRRSYHESIDLKPPVGWERITRK
jgi:hypothetical protein